jgi:hypothetical protein
MLCSLLLHVILFYGDWDGMVQVLFHGTWFWGDSVLWLTWKRQADLFRVHGLGVVTLTNLKTIDNCMLRHRDGDIESSSSTTYSHHITIIHCPVCDIIAMHYTASYRIKIVFSNSVIGSLGLGSVLVSVLKTGVTVILILGWWWLEIWLPSV